MESSEIIDVINLETQDKEIVSVKHLYGTVWLKLDRVTRDRSDHEIGLVEIWFSGNWKLIDKKQEPVFASDDEEFFAEEADLKLEKLIGTKIESIDLEDEKIIMKLDNKYSVEVGTVDGDTFNCSVYEFEGGPKLLRTLGYDLYSEDGWYMRNAGEEIFDSQDQD